MGNDGGHLTSSVLNSTYDTQGKVKISGELKMTVGQTASGATFIGEMTGDISSGTWENPKENLHGKWKGSRSHIEP